jgi:outer membrane immunogenic protein
MFTKLSIENRRSAITAVMILVATAMLLFSVESRADSGFYIGGSIGQAGIEIDDGNTVLPLSFDEDDLGYKVFAGYNFQFTIISLGLEAGYVNFGEPSADILGSQLAIEATGINAFGVVGLALGPIGVFAKYGVMSWDAEGTIDGLADFSEDGSEPMYGIGAKIGFGSLDLRLEYEAIDLDADGVSESDANMVSLGLTWTF